jgi:ribosome-binding protein aMBF1 (putative translation factor)
MNWNTHKKLLLKDPKFRKAVEETRLEYEIARAIILARVEKKMTQKELAIKLKTKQSVISRIENAQTTPSLSFLKRLASVFNTELKVELGNI